MRLHACALESHGWLGRRAAAATGTQRRRQGITQAGSIRCRRRHSRRPSPIITGSTRSDSGDASGSTPTCPDRTMKSCADDPSAGLDDRRVHEHQQQKLPTTPTPDRLPPPDWGTGDRLHGAGTIRDEPYCQPCAHPARSLTTRRGRCAVRPLGRGPRPVPGESQECRPVMKAWVRRTIVPSMRVLATRRDPDHCA